MYRNEFKYEWVTESGPNCQPKRDPAPNTMALGC